jgi:hypothetical protein
VVGKSFNEAFKQTELVEWDLDKILTPYMKEGVWPDPLPTAETVGLLYSFLETLLRSGGIRGLR